jgi:hypothetical protein
LQVVILLLVFLHYLLHLGLDLVERLALHIS